MQQTFWMTVCLIDQALNNVYFPQETKGIAQVLHDWAIKSEARHGFASKMWTAMAVDGFVMENKQHDGSALNGKDINCYGNRKGFGV
jgi:hypothetical protein